MLENYCQAYTDSYMSRKFWQLHVLQKTDSYMSRFAKFAQAACLTVTYQIFSKQRSDIGTMTIHDLVIVNFTPIVIDIAIHVNTRLPKSRATGNIVSATMCGTACQSIELQGCTV